MQMSLVAAVKPVAVKAASHQQPLLPLQIGVRAFQCQLWAPKVLQDSLRSRSFSASAVAQGSDNLATILQEEQKYERENYSKPEELAAGPPSPFKLTESPRDAHLSLTRIYKSEEIVIDILVNESDADESGEPFTNEAGEIDMDTDVGVIFNVTSTKGDQSLVFEVKCDGSYLQVLHASLETPDDAGDTAYDGPVYSELDERLQHEFEEFLAERGVTAELGTYILALVDDKEQREYMTWLGNVEKFVKS
ncbi:hypothetical protein WJX72_004225 [[Myrmecia] bisecta]|uniref:Mitochondrial glycoprotein n=1 Tax=[Myrmecia] bisecta TaxID=41462 RepID=A0AAW1P4P3_9CHLO